MAQCPNCSKSIAVTEDHFGTLYRCEHCKTEFFIGFDGAPENSKEPLASDMIAKGPEPLVSSADQQPVSLTDMLATPNSEPEYSSGGESGSADLFNIQTASDEQPEMPATEDVFKNFAEDVQNFGNEISESGILTFDIEISGIDLGETKRELLDALDDKRFGWNLDDITQNIKDGTLTITNVSAPKIIVLVKRITPIGLNLNWRHHVSTQ